MHLDTQLCRSRGLCGSKVRFDLCLHFLGLLSLFQDNIPLPRELWIDVECQSVLGL
jgi:hypothetical protein